MPTRDDGSQSRTTRKGTESEEITEQEQPGAEAAERNAKLTEDVDDLLDEIDDVLEENAEDFVRSYIQKGGE